MRKKIIEKFCGKFYTVSKEKYQDSTKNLQIFAGKNFFYYLPSRNRSVFPSM